MNYKTASVKNQNRTKNNIFMKKLKHALEINNNLRKRNEELSDQNKELSTTRNNLSMEKLSLQKENNSLRNSNIQLTAMHNIMNKKLIALEQTIQSCIPALVNMSQCIPSMLETVHEMSKFEIKDFKKETKVRLIKTVNPMIKGHIIMQPKLILSPFDLSTLRKSPNTSAEKTLASTSSGNTDNTFDGTEERRNELISPINPRMPRNITSRKRPKQSTDSSSALDIDDSTSSSRPSRACKKKKINYKEKSLGDKLWR